MEGSKPLVRGQTALRDRWGFVVVVSDGANSEKVGWMQAIVLTGHFTTHYVVSSSQRLRASCRLGAATWSRNGGEPQISELTRYVW